MRLPRKKGISCYLKPIATVDYRREEKQAGEGNCLVTYLENEVTFTDGSKATRIGIIRINGKTVRDMAKSLKTAIRTKAGDRPNWWSLQATSLAELKAAYQAGFRNRNLPERLEAHIEAFKFKKRESLHVEYFA